MSRFKLTGIFFLPSVFSAVVGICYAEETRQPEMTVLWQIGTSDNDTAEFSLGPKDYKQYREPGVFVVGRSTPEKDWPYVQPGTGDRAWAPGGPHTFVILFGLKAAPTKPCRLLLDLVDTHPARPPELRVEINGQARQFQTPKGAADESVLGDPSKGRPEMAGSGMGRRPRNRRAKRAIPSI